MDKCKWERESRSTCCPDVVHLRCNHPDIKGILNCIGYEECCDYIQANKNEDRK